MKQNKKIKDFFDKSYKSLFENRVFIKSLINFVLPDKIKSIINWKSLSTEKINFIPPDLGSRKADILYSIKLKNKKYIYIYLLLEFKSTPDKITPLLLYIYTGLIYHHLIKIGKIKREKPEVPVIVPIVLYIGDRRWQVARCMRELMAVEVYKELKRYVPDLRYILIDKHRYSDKQLEEMKDIISGLLYIEKISKEDIEERINRYIKIFLKGIGRRERRVLIEYISKMIEHRYKKVVSIEEGRKKRKEVEKMLATAIAEWEEELIQKGKQIGVQEGIQKGIEKSRRETAKKLLELGIEIEKIQKATGLSKEEIEKLK